MRYTEPEASGDPAHPSIDWNHYASAYRQVVEAAHPHRQLIAELMELARPAPGERLVDAGCGAGAVLASALAHGARCIGLERSPAFVDAARQRLGEQVVIHERDICCDWAPTIEPASVDIVTACNVLYALDAPDRFLAEVRRALKPGGRLVVTSPHRRDIGPVMAAHDRWLTDGANDAERGRWQHTIDRGLLAFVVEVNRRLSDDRRLHFLDASAWQARVEQAGLHVTHVRSDAYAGVNVLLRAERR